MVDELFDYDVLNSILDINNNLNKCEMNTNECKVNECEANANKYEAIECKVNECKLACVIMVKNESKRIQVTLESILGYAHYVIIYDTESTDNTLDIIRTFCTTHDLLLFIKEGTFVDFSTSRNVLLEFADDIARNNPIEYLLLLDCNDELRDGDKLIDMCNEYKSRLDISAFLIRQEWFCGDVDILTYYNVRLIKPCYGWRYVGVVHEYIKNEHPSQITKCPSNIYLFQNRVLDDDKSRNRAYKDMELLLSEYNKNPNNERTVFYLAQTYDGLKMYDNAFTFYSKRIKMGSYQEEVYQSLFKMGEIGLSMRETTYEYSWEKIIHYLLSAYQCINRVEPLLLITEYYRSTNEWALAYIFIRQAYDLELDKDCNLFVNRYYYEYYRYHLYYLVCFHCGKREESYRVCKLLADKYGKQVDIDHLKMVQPNTTST